MDKYLKILITSLIIYIPFGQAQEDDLSLFGYHVETCVNCNTEFDFQNAAQAKIIADPSGSTILNKLVVIGNIDTKTYKAYRVSKVVEPGYMRTTVNPTSIPTKVADTFANIEQVLSEIKSQTPIENTASSILVPVTIPKETLGSANDLVNGDEVSLIINRNSVANYIRMTKISNSLLKMTKESWLLLTKRGTKILTKFADGSSAIFLFNLSTTSAEPYVYLFGSACTGSWVNSICVGQLITPNSPSSGGTQESSGSFGAVYNGITLGSTVQKCRSYQIKTSQGEVYSGTICWYYIP